MNQADRQKIQQTISILQSLLGGGSDNCAPPSFVIPGFKEEVQSFTSIANHLQNQIKQLNTALVEAIDFMEKIMAYSTSNKKPSGSDLQGLQHKFQVISHRIDNVAKNPNYNYHCKAIRQLMSAHFWVFVDAPEDVFKGSIQSADFNAIKFQRLKNMGHNDWYKSVGKAYRILQDYVKKNMNMGLTYNGAGSNNWNQLLSGQAKTQASSSSHQSSHQQKQQAPKPVNKPPKKQMQGLNWLIANFNKQKIVFKPGQIQMKHGAFIQNCADCAIIIEDKFKSLQMNKCKNVTLIVHNCVSGVDLMNCENINVHVKGLIPSLAVDKCQKVRILLSEKHLDVDIVSSKVTELQIAYETTDGNESKDQAVSEQLITRWNHATKKFETKVYDKFL